MTEVKNSADALKVRLSESRRNAIDRIWPKYVGQMHPDQPMPARAQPLPFYSNSSRPATAKSMEEDWGRLLQWLLDSTTGSFSDWHCDAAGGLTIVRILSGQKLWIIETVGEGTDENDEHPAEKCVDVLLLSAGDIL
jgi:hypothetical protein